MARPAASDAQDAMDAFREELRDTGRKAQRALRAGWKASNRRMRGAAARTGRQLNDAHDVLGAQMHQRPLAFAAGAIATGIVLGLLIASQRGSR